MGAQLHWAGALSLPWHWSPGVGDLHSPVHFKCFQSLLHWKESILTLLEVFRHLFCWNLTEICKHLGSCSAVCKQRRNWLQTQVFLWHCPDVPLFPGAHQQQTEMQLSSHKNPDPRRTDTSICWHQVLSLQHCLTSRSALRPAWAVGSLSIQKK